MKSFNVFFRLTYDEEISKADRNQQSLTLSLGAVNGSITRRISRINSFTLLPTI